MSTEGITVAMTIDTITLTSIINSCFRYSSDGRIPEVQQSMLLGYGKNLRALLLGLLSTQFETGTAAVSEANTHLTSVNVLLSSDASALADVAQTLTSINSLVTSLNQALTVAASFL
jgi:hypothetical protein